MNECGKNPKQISVRATCARGMFSVDHACGTCTVYFLKKRQAKLEIQFVFMEERKFKIWCFLRK